MRSEWYGDKKDLVKWQSLLYMARREGIKRICQIAMCTDAEPETLAIRVLDGGAVEDQDVRQQVNEHFRRVKNLEQVKSLGKSFNIEVDVRSGPFTHPTRGQYFGAILNEIRASKLRTVWFFDPDTGIEPESSAPNDKHVKLSELEGVFQSLPTGDYLACYQHSWRKPGWENDARARLAKRLGKSKNEVEMFTSDNATNVIILAVEKTYC